MKSKKPYNSKGRTLFLTDNIHRPMSYFILRYNTISDTIRASLSCIMNYIVNGSASKSQIIIYSNILLSLC